MLAAIDGMSHASHSTVDPSSLVPSNKHNISVTMPKLKRSKKKGEVLRHAPLITDLQKQESLRQKRTSRKSVDDEEDQDVEKETIVEDPHLRREGDMYESIDPSHGSISRSGLGDLSGSDLEYDDEDEVILSSFSFPILKPR